MKSKFRKVNRGLILSILVVLGLAAYYVVLGIQAAPEKKGMDETLSGYFQVFAPSFLVPEEYKRPDVTEEDVEQLAEGIQEKFRPYFADQKSLSYFMENTILPQLRNQTIYPTQDVTQSVCDYQKLLDVDIDKETGTATARVRVKTSNNITYYEAIYHEDGRVTKKPSGSNSGYEWQQELTFSMQKADGKWLITGFSGYWL